MIGDLIDKIQDAEKRAATLIAEAYEKAAAIECAAQAEIEKIKNETYDEIAKKVNRIATQQKETETTPPPHKPITVSEKNIAEAKKLILAEFRKKYLDEVASWKYHC